MLENWKEDGLVSVLRLYLEPLSPQRSSQPADLGYGAVPEQTIGHAAHSSSTGVLVLKAIIGGLAGKLPDRLVVHCNGYVGHGRETQCDGRPFAAVY